MTRPFEPNAANVSTSYPAPPTLEELRLRYFGPRLEDVPDWSKATDEQKLATCGAILRHWYPDGPPQLDL